MAGQLAHVGKIEDADVRPIVSPGGPYGYRNRMDFRVVGGAPALHRSSSKQLVALGECHILHPSLQEVFDRLGDLSGATGVTLRVSETTGRRLAVVTGTVPPQAGEWGCAVARRTREGVRAIVGRPSLREEIEGANLRVTGTAFFQNSRAGARSLVALVADALDNAPGEVMVDGFAGGGLFAATIGRTAGEVVAIETDPTAVADLAHNLEQNHIHGEVIEGRFEDELGSIPGQIDTLVIDPPRTGLRTRGVEAILDTMPQTVAYVSCDPASFARDAAGLVAGGYRLDWVTPVDLFPQTWHVESVARFRVAGTG